MRTPARVAVWAGVVAVLGAVFAAWRSPHLVVDLAAFVAACF